MQQLGAEEHQLHAASLQVQSNVKTLLASVFQCPEAQDRQLQLCMAQLRAHIRDLELLAEEQDTDDQACAVEQLLRQHKAEYESLRASITAAKLAAKQATEMAFAQQRKELLSGAALPTLQRSMGNEAQAAEGAQAITESLRRSRMALAQQLDQTAGNLEVTESGSARLSTTKEELSSQEGLFKESRQSLKELRKQSSGDRWLLWAGLSLFLLVAAYIAYKRAPAAAKLPIDAVLGVIWRLLCAAAGVLAFVGQALGGLVLRGGSAAIVAVRNARSSSSGSGSISSSTVLHAPGKPLHLQPPAPAPHSQAPLPPPNAPHWEAALDEAHETDGLGMAPQTALEGEATVIDGGMGLEREADGHGVATERPEREADGHGVAAEGSKGGGEMAQEGRDTDGGADEREAGKDDTGSRSSSFSSFESEGVFEMSTGLPPFTDVTEGFGFVGGRGDDGAEDAALEGEIEGSEGVQHAREMGEKGGGEGVEEGAEQVEEMSEEAGGEAGAEGGVQGSQVMGGEPGIAKVGEGAEQEEDTEEVKESNGAAQEEDRGKGRGRALEGPRDDGEQDSTADGETQGDAAVDEETRKQPPGDERGEGVVDGETSDGGTAAEAQGPEKLAGVVTDEETDGEAKGRQQGSKVRAYEAAVHGEEVAESGEGVVAQEVDGGMQGEVGKAATDAGPAAAADEAAGAADEGAAEEPVDDEVGVPTQAKVSQEACNAKAGEREVRGECAEGAHLAGESQEEEVEEEEDEEKEEALVAQQTESDQEDEPEEKDGTAPAEEDHDMDEKEEASREEAMTGKGDKEFEEEHGDSASRSAQGAGLEKEMEGKSPAGDAPEEELVQKEDEQGDACEASSEPEAEQQGCAPAAKLDEVAEAEAAATGLEDAAEERSGAPASQGLEKEEREEEEGKEEKEEEEEEEEEEKGEDKEEGGQEEGGQEAGEQQREGAKPASGEEGGGHKVGNGDGQEVSASEAPASAAGTAEGAAGYGSTFEDQARTSPDEQPSIKQQQQQRQQQQQQQQQQQEAHPAANNMQSRQEHHQGASIPAFPGSRMSKKWPDEQEQEAAVKHAHAASIIDATAGRDGRSSQQQQQQQQQQGLKGGDAGPTGSSEQGHAAGVKPHGDGEHQEELQSSLEGGKGKEQEGYHKGDEHDDQRLLDEKRQQQQQQQQQQEQEQRRSGHENGLLDNETHAQLRGGGKDGLEEGVAGGIETGSSQLNGESKVHLQWEEGEDIAVAEWKDVKAKEEEEYKEEEELEPVLVESEEGDEHAGVKDGSTEEGVGRLGVRKQQEEGREAYDQISEARQKQEGGVKRGQGAGVAEENGIDVAAGATENDLGEHSQEGEKQIGSTEPWDGPERAEEDEEGESGTGGSLGKGGEGLAVTKDRDVPAWAKDGEKRYSNNTVVGGPKGLGLSKGGVVGAKKNGGQGSDDDEQLQQLMQALKHEAEENDVVRGEAAKRRGKQHVKSNVEKGKDAFLFRGVGARSANSSTGTDQH